jgi:phospholipid/cholesterol/gamma-HCH transport system substrate-binding protein
MEKTTLDLWVGIFVAAGLAALLVLALKVGNMSSVNLGDGYQVQAQFDNIGGLKARAPVKSAGVVVGRVTAITFDTERFEAKVTMTVDHRFQFPKDTSASIMTSGLLGEQYVGLEAGADSVKLKDGDSIKLTQSAVVLENLIGQFLYGKAAEGQPKPNGASK